MMLSPLRFWCVVGLCAAAACAWLIQPVNQFAKQSALKYAFGTNLSAKDFKLHRQQELLEVNNVAATQADEVFSVDVSADLALVKLDMPTLLDKRFVSSRVKLQGVRIELTSLPIQQPPTTVSKSWQKSLEEVLVAFQWDSLRDDCEALLKSDVVLNELQERMRAWLLRSQQIMFHGDQLTRTIQGYSNPLRHQNEIRNQLMQIEQLRTEQDGLLKQFSGVNKVLASQLKEIRTLGDQDIASIRTKQDAQAKSLQVLTAEQLVTEWAKQLTTRQLQLSQSVATLLQSNSRTNPYDVDVRSPLSKTPLISLSGIEAEGFLCDATKEVPFSAKGEYSTTPQVDYRIGRKTDWEIQFESDKVNTQLQIASSDDGSGWKITSSASECGTVADTGATMLEVEASIADRQLKGKARMNLGSYFALMRLPCSGNADLAALSVSSGATADAGPTSEAWIDLTVSGSAMEPCIAIVGSLPTEFTDSITNGIQKQIETQRDDIESKLKIALDAKVDELSKQLESLAKNGQQTLTKQQETLAAMHRDLEQALQTRDGVEYARLPAKSSTSR